MPIKKLMLPILACAAMFMLNGCGSAHSDAFSSQKPGRPAVIYFSWSGNTQKAAEITARHTGADLYRIVPVKPYPENYQAIVQQAKTEKENGVRPEIITGLKDMRQYDVIFLCYPIWWHTMPAPVFTFLEKYDFSGKTIIPLATHEGSSFGSSLSDIRRAAPQAILGDGLELRGHQAAGAEDKIAGWLQKYGF